MPSVSALTPMTGAPKLPQRNNMHLYRASNEPAFPPRGSEAALGSEMATVTRTDGSTLRNPSARGRSVEKEFPLGGKQWSKARRTS